MPVFGQNMLENKLHFHLYLFDYYAIKCTYVLVIPGNHASKCFSTMCSNFPQKFEQSRNTENSIATSTQFVNTKYLTAVPLNKCHLLRINGGVVNAVDK